MSLHVVGVHKGELAVGIRPKISECPNFSLSVCLWNEAQGLRNNLHHNSGKTCAVDVMKRKCESRAEGEQDEVLFLSPKNLHLPRGFDL